MAELRITIQRVITFYQLLTKSSIVGLSAIHRQPADDIQMGSVWTVPEQPRSPHLETRKHVTFNLYIDCSNNLGNLSPLGHNLVEAAALLRVREVLQLEDLKFSILLYEGDDGDAIVF